jgi:hypothetical protein
MFHTNPEFENFEFDSDLEFDQHLGSHKHVINIIMWFRDMGCYKDLPHSSDDADDGWQWEIQTDEGWVSYWDSQV